ncbi:MAG: DUF4041 domain-containing protein [Anaerolineae bacterium]|nr:DUF4041 domain-containing protein [Anaerolineae bacterium]
MSKAKFEAAKELIDKKDYAGARTILKGIDHPTARAWEAKLDVLAPQKTNLRSAIPLLGFLDINKLKAELETTAKERDQLKKAMSIVSRMEAYGLMNAVQELLAKQKEVNEQIQVTQLEAQRRSEASEIQAARQRATLEQQIDALNRQIAEKQSEVIQLDEQMLLQSFGFYKPQYDFATSDLYKNHLENIRKQQAKMIKDGTACYGSTTWTVNNSQKEGERLIKDYVKLILRSFNNECDASIVDIKFNNVASIEKKLQKAFDTLNKLGERMTITISQQYLKLKLQELYLCHEYQVKKQEEKEEQKLIREQMREEAKLIKEIEEAKAKLEKEQKHFYKALGTINEQLQKVTTDIERQALEAEKAKIEEKVGEVADNLLTVEKREQNTRAGYVYVISNLGSFGDNVYKIGVTRRLEPQERVDELGDASVPFNFDVHALIFSDDAPKLEHAIHKAFEKNRLNMINNRREFFHVSLEEIERVVKQNFEKPVDFTRTAAADQYRQSLKLKSGLGTRSYIPNSEMTIPTLSSSVAL